MSYVPRSPAELRGMFGANLKKLAQAYPSVSELSRRLGINRTQLNRYLWAESFPRPDVLEKICRFFDVDARILLEPVETLSNSPPVLNGPVLRGFLGPALTGVDPVQLPDGLYRFSRLRHGQMPVYAQGILLVFRQDEQVFVRGYDPRHPDLRSSARAREYRGLILQANGRISMLMARRAAKNMSLAVLSPAKDSPGKVWTGYATLASTPAHPAAMVLEGIGHKTNAAMHAARYSGTVDPLDLPTLHRDLLDKADPL